MKKILLVDDDSDILEVVKLILEGSGYQVMTSNDGNIIGIIENDMPDLILLDMLLCGEDGRDITRKIRKNGKTKNARIVMMSAYPNANKLALDAGANDFIQKPFQIEHLLAIVARHIRS